MVYPPKDDTVIEPGTSNRPSRVLILGGVSGSGKSTIGFLVAEHLRWRFIDGNSLHSRQNIEKMRAGVPLDDKDRKPWLDAIHNQIAFLEDCGFSAVIECSALKSAFRKSIAKSFPNVSIIILTLSEKVAMRRVANRPKSYFPLSLVNSQYQTLEIDEDTCLINSEGSTDRIVAKIVDLLDRNFSLSEKKK